MEKLHSNQRGIRIVKQVSDTNNPYSIFNVAATHKALKLPPNAFKIWAYLNLNANNREFGLSTKDLCEVCNMSKPTVLAAIRTLIDEGYLVEVELYPNLTGYLFLESNGGEQERKEF